MNDRMLACTCGRKVRVQYPKCDRTPEIKACDSYAPINHDGTPRIK